MFDIKVGSWFVLLVHFIALRVLLNRFAWLLRLQQIYTSIFLYLAILDCLDFLSFFLHGLLLQRL